MAQRPVVSLTAEAAALLKDIFRKRGDSAPHLRVYVAGRCGSCNGIGASMAIADAPMDIDLVGVSRGVKVVVDRDGAKLLRGSVVRVVKTPDGPAFKLDIANAHCDCHGHERHLNWGGTTTPRSGRR